MRADGRVWRDVAAVLGVVAVVLLAARQLRPLVYDGVLLARTHDVLVPAPAAGWTRAAVWSVAVVAVLLRWRVLAAGVAWAGVAFEVTEVVRRLDRPPLYAWPLDLLAWPLELAVVAALLLSAPVPAGRGAELLGRRGGWLLAGAGAVLALSAATEPLLANYPPAPEDDPWAGTSISYYYDSRLPFWATIATAVITLALLLLATAGTPTPVRRRVWLAVAVAVAGYATVQIGLPQPFTAGLFPPVDHATQAASFAVAVGLCLVAGVIWIRRRERSEKPD